MPNTTFRITNITCAACVKLSIMALKKIAGVTHATVDEANGHTELTAEREVTWNEITAALNTVGKQASL